MRTFKIFLGTTGILLLLMSMALAADAPVAAAPVIVVTGEGEVKVVPDEVILTLGVSTKNMDLAKSASDNNDRVKRVFKVLTNHGVEAKKIRTDYMNCEPAYETDQQSKKRTFTGYRVSKKIVATLNDLSKFESVLSGVMGSAITSVHGIQFRTTELRKHRDTARDMAMKHAKEKAEAMAGAIGQKIGRAKSITEPGSHYLGMPQAYQQQYSRASDQEAQLGETIALGEIGVTARVSVTFELQ